MTTPDSAYAKSFLRWCTTRSVGRGSAGWSAAPTITLPASWKRYSLSPKGWDPGPFRSFVDLYDLFTPGNTVTGIDACRVWVGDYRIVYDVADAVRIVTVSYVGQCREIYHNI